VTYNFDPDRWFENQRRALDGRRDRGEIGAAEHQAELDLLEARYEQMSSRLNAAFELPRREAPPAASPPGRGPDEP
jgi:hypothetical protein